MRDRLLEMMFEPQRWQNLLEHSAEKGINKGELRQYANPQIRAMLLERIIKGNLAFSPAHQAAIPKDEPGEFRIVYVGDACERILCSLINDCLFDLFPDMVHQTCKSYQKGIGTGKVVKELRNKFKQAKGKVIGARYDFHHYFDTVNREVIMCLFDTVEARLGFEYGTEPVMNLLRQTWNNDLMFDLDGNLIEKWSGIRQGNAVGSWLADAVLYELDEFMSKKYDTYVRYSDDLIVLGNDVAEITADINRIVSKYGVSLNMKKVKPIEKREYLKFLGFAIRDDDITISQGRLKKFQKEIDKRTIKANGGRGCSYEKAINNVNRYLYKGDGEHSWATSMLTVVRNDRDVEMLNRFVMDRIRACKTKRRKLPGLGYDAYGTHGVVLYKTDGWMDVCANRKSVGKDIEGYYSIGCMRKDMLINRDVYNTIVMGL